MPYDDPILRELGGYFKAEEPGRRERADAWATAIGLQKVDGLTPSQFLFDTAKDHIEGRITQNQARRRIHDYYAAQAEVARPDPDKEEADKVSERIVAVLNDGGFAFTPEYFISIHAKLFKGVLPSAGKLPPTATRRRSSSRLSATSSTSASSTTAARRRARSFRTSRASSPRSGRCIRSGKATRARRRFSPSSTCGPSASRWTTTPSATTPGISAMRSCGRTTPTMRARSSATGAIWRYSSAIFSSESGTK